MFTFQTESNLIATVTCFFSMYITFVNDLSLCAPVVHLAKCSISLRCVWLACNYFLKLAIICSSLSESSLAVYGEAS